MELPTNPPLGQPVAPQPGGERFVPQPLEAGPPPVSPHSKRLLTLVGVGAGLLILIGGVVWFLSQNAKTEYREVVTDYQQHILQLRDGMNNELQRQDLSGSSAQARPIFEAYGKQLQALTAKAPAEPKVLAIIPVTVDDEANQLTAAANAYAAALRHDFALYNYYTQVTTAFQPIRNLGTITLFNVDKMQALNTLWPPYLSALKATKPPAELTKLHTDLTAQATSLGTQIEQLAKNFATNTPGANDQALGQLGPLAKTMNDTFTTGVSKASEAAFNNVNQTYDALDKLLK